MIPCLYDSREMKFDNNGIGKLADAQSCTVTEKRNGSYELKLICPADGIHAEMLEASWKCRHGIFPTSSTLSRYRLFQ